MKDALKTVLQLALLAYVCFLLALGGVLITGTERLESPLDYAYRESHK